MNERLDALLNADYSKEQQQKVLDYLEKEMPFKETIKLATLTTALKRYSHNETIMNSLACRLDFDATIDDDEWRQFKEEVAHQKNNTAIVNTLDELLAYKYNSQDRDEFTLLKKGIELLTTQDTILTHKITQLTTEVANLEKEDTLLGLYVEEKNKKLEDLQALQARKTVLEALMKKSLERTQALEGPRVPSSGASIHTTDNATPRNSLHPPIAAYPEVRNNAFPQPPIAYPEAVKNVLQAPTAYPEAAKNQFQPPIAYPEAVKNVLQPPSLPETKFSIQLEGHQLQDRLRFVHPKENPNSPQEGYVDELYTEGKGFQYKVNMQNGDSPTKEYKIEVPIKDKHGQPIQGKFDTIILDCQGKLLSSSMAALNAASGEKSQIDTEWLQSLSRANLQHNPLKQVLQQGQNPPTQPYPAPPPPNTRQNSTPPRR